jgi:hypothetical protein
MRLLLVCLALFLAPAACLIATDRFVTGIENDFRQDARWQIQRFDRIVEMYPPRAATLHNAAAIEHLKRYPDGGAVAAAICGPSNSPYTLLFERLSIRCGEWSILGRARSAALLGVGLSFVTLGLVLVARIAVLRYQDRLQWAGPWTTLSTFYGLPVILGLQVTAALAGFAILFRVLVPRPLYAYLGLLIPWLALFWIERRLVNAFVEPRKLVPGRPHRRSRLRRPLRAEI